MLSANLAEAGYLPIQAYDGIEALDQMKKELPDFIVLDLIMPKIDGYRLAKYLRSDPEFSGIPIIILTGIAAEDARQIFEVEADAFIAKGKLDDTFRNLLSTLRWLGAKKT